MTTVMMRIMMMTKRKSMETTMGMTSPTQTRRMVARSIPGLTDTFSSSMQWVLASMEAGETPMNESQVEDIQLPYVFQIFIFNLFSYQIHCLFSYDRPATF